MGLGVGQGAQAGEDVGGLLGLRDGVRGDDEDELGDADGDEAVDLLLEVVEGRSSASLEGAGSVGAG